MNFKQRVLNFIDSVWDIGIKDPGPRGYFVITHEHVQKAKIPERPVKSAAAAIHTMQPGQAPVQGPAINKSVNEYLTSVDELVNKIRAGQDQEVRSDMMTSADQVIKKFRADQGTEFTKDMLTSVDREIEEFQRVVTNGSK